MGVRKQGLRTCSGTSASVQASCSAFTSQRLEKMAAVTGHRLASMFILRGRGCRGMRREVRTTAIVMPMGITKRQRGQSATCQLRPRRRLVPRVAVHGRASVRNLRLCGRDNDHLHRRRHRRAVGRSTDDCISPHPLESRALMYDLQHLLGTPALTIMFERGRRSAGGRSRG
jgi:hypothetical protein